MKEMLCSGLAMVALAAMCAAQLASTPSNNAQQVTAAQDSSNQSQSSNQWPTGTIISAELSRSVDAKKAKVGDRIEAKLPADVLLHGKVVIPRNTKMIGHITEVKAHSKESPDSMIGIAFDRVVMKDGRELTIQVAVQAIGRPLQIAALSGDTVGDGTGMPSASTSPTGGVAMGGSMPSRSPERVASIPLDPASGANTASDRGTVAPLGPTSQGVVGVKGLSLKASGQSSVVSSQTDNVRLESGTQLILRTQ